MIVVARGAIIERCLHHFLHSGIAPIDPHNPAKQFATTTTREKYLTLSQRLDQLLSHIVEYAIPNPQMTICITFPPKRDGLKVEERAPPYL
jgi:hypothetical protein